VAFKRQINAVTVVKTSKTEQKKSGNWIPVALCVKA
jgi:hypothetical protein